MGKQPHHFLKSKKARDLTAYEVATYSDEKARAEVERVRWDGAAPTCPHCGADAWRINAKRKCKDGSTAPRPLFTCKSRDCRKQFSAISGTKLEGLGVSLRQRLYEVFQFSRGPKGYAALWQPFQTGLTHKSAFVLQHRIREALGGVTHLRKGEYLSGSVEADVMFVGGYKRPARHSKHRVDRRLKEYLTGKRHGILVIRERRGKGRVLTFIVKNEADARRHIYNSVEEGARLYLDASPSWGDFSGHYDVKQVDHSTTFARWEDGHAVNDNLAESFFSRVRRAEIGIHHRISGRYSGLYAIEMAWREANRRKTAREQFDAILKALLQQPPDEAWKGYWRERPKVAA